MESIKQLVRELFGVRKLAKIGVAREIFLGNP
jgi:hypothetical protein